MDELTTRSSPVAELEQRVARLEARGAGAPSQPELASGSATPEPVDDLRRISGIGPAFERVLHSLGVRSYAEIAAWTAEDIERIARLLRVNRARMNSWPEQARQLGPPASPPETAG
jgi:predicted flap endonuclease-1-like 5' DNA nuclease